MEENPRYAGTPIPADIRRRQQLLRALENVRPPWPAPSGFVEMEAEELRAQLLEKGTVRPESDGLSLWQGDITRLETDAIVNAANAQMLGCWVPLHGCIDNAIHSAAGVRLRIACNNLMQGREARTGEAHITPAFCLPSKYVIHTVGPIVSGLRPTARQEEELATCYRNCLSLAEDNSLESIAFCCISTGVFHFPGRLAAEIAVRTVKNWLLQGERRLRTVVFNVFKDMDYAIYKEILNREA